jgi:two-component system sensor histidine kinase CpxA
LKPEIYESVSQSFSLVSGGDCLMVLVVIFLTWTTQTEPVVSRWQTSVINQTNIYASTAGQIYQNEGEEGLKEFLVRIREAETIEEIGLINQKGEFRNLQVPLTEPVRQIISRAFSSEKVELDINQPLSIFAARIVPLENGEKYVLVVQWDRPRPTPFFGEANYRYGRLLGLFLTAMALCYLFARYLSAPVIKLSEAAKNLAAGNLQTRVAPQIGKRKDEIGRLAADFDEMAERIEALIVSQKRLTRDVSHELRSPLARMNVALELAKQKGNQESQSLLGRIERESRQLNEMISQILQLSKLESQSETIERKNIEIGKLIEKIVADANFEAESQGKKVLIKKRRAAKFSATKTCSKARSKTFCETLFAIRNQRSKCFCAARKTILLSLSEITARACRSRARKTFHAVLPRQRSARA